MFVVFVNGEPDWCTPFEVSALEFADVMRARGYHVEVEEQ